MPPLTDFTAPHFASSAGKGETTIPLVAISACLLGQNVRYDGGHKWAGSLVESLGQVCRWLPLCPEFEIGLGVPRPKIELRDRGEVQLRLAVIETGEDLTERMLCFAAEKIGQLRAANIAGCVLKSRSPSCGVGDARVVVADGERLDGDGLFARQLISGWPRLPVATEAELTTFDTRAHFLGRVLAEARLGTLERTGPGPSDWVDFHTREKMLLLAHNQAAYRRLGPLVALAGSTRGAETWPQYVSLFAESYSQPLDAAGHANTLQHASGHLRGVATPQEQREAGAAIDAISTTGQWRPAWAIVSALAAKYGVDYLLKQTYFRALPEMLLDPPA